VVCDENAHVECAGQGLWEISMIGWVLLAVGVVVLVQELWLQPRSMAKARDGVARRGDPRKFDRYLGSRVYRWGRWWALGGGAFLVVGGLLLVIGVA
jgi:hypothetical protein